MGKTKKSILESRKEKFIDLYNQKYSDVEIGKFLEVSRKTVERFRNKLSLSPNKRKILTEENVLSFIEEGKTDIEISKHFNVSRSAVKAFRNKRNIPSNIRSVISKNDSIIIRELHTLGFENSFISKITNKSIETIEQFLSYKDNSKEYTSNEPIIAKEDMSVLIGILLGDGNIDYKKTKNSCFTITHSPKQRDYLIHIAKRLIKYPVRIGVCTSSLDTRTNKCYTSYWLRISSSRFFTYLYKIFYPNGIKIIPDYIYNYYNAESLAYHFMDDGCKTDKSYKIATNCFTIKELRKFQYFLLQKFNIETTIHKDNGLYIRYKSVKTFEEVISPYIIDSMKYKLHVT